MYNMIKGWKGHVRKCWCGSVYSTWHYYRKVLKADSYIHCMYMYVCILYVCAVTYIKVTGMLHMCPAHWVTV